MTEPELPVEHGTTLTLNCLKDYTNKGGNTATCQNGQVVPSNEPPDCRGEHADKSYLDHRFDDGLQRFKEHLVIDFDLCYFDLPTHFT